MSSSVPLCPITCEPIFCPGLTQFGSLYEFSAITKWLEYNCTDPVKGLTLPSRFVWKIDPLLLQDEKALEAQQKELHAQTLMVYPGLKKFLSSFDNYNKLLATYNDLKQNKTFADYQNKRVEEFKQDIELDRYSVRFGGYGQNHNTAEYIFLAQEPSYRNSVWLEGFVGANLSRIGNKLVEEKSFKCSSFNFANMSGLLFKECSFSSCTFLGADLRETIFFGCNFIGDCVSFVNARSNAQTMFFLCEIEPIGSWEATSESNEVRTILKSRGLARCGVYDAMNQTLLNHYQHIHSV